MRVALTSKRILNRASRWRRRTAEAKP